MSDIGYQARPLSRQDIRRFATRLRAVMGFADELFVDVEEVIDLILPRLMPEFVYDIRPRSEMGNNHGLAEPDKAFLVLREDVYERACCGRGRDRLTVMHEIGHLLLHTRDRIVLRRGTGKPKAYCDPEWQANCFAGEFLMAYTLVHCVQGPEEAATAFGLSTDAAHLQWDRFRQDGLV